MDQIYNTDSSPGFRGVMYSFSIVSVFLAIGFIIVAFPFYGRGREADGISEDQQKWVLLFATWRDSLIITLLFTAEGLIYRYNDFYGLSEAMAGSIFLYAPIMVPVFGLVLYILIFTVIAIRIIAISRWLAVK